MTIVGISRMALTAQKAAEILEEEHEVSAEVIDPRTLRPLDLDTILESVRQTNRCVIVEEGWPHGGVGANLAALIQEQAFDFLDAPIARVTGADLPMPYSKPLEQIAFPHEPQVVETVLVAASNCKLPSQGLLQPRAGVPRRGHVPLTPGVANMRTPLLGAATIAVLAAGALATTSVIGSSHREAPRIMLDPSADNTDVYAFVAPDAPGKVTIVSNWVPLQSPAGGPYFGKLDPDGALLRQDRQHRRRRRGRRLSLAVQEPASATRTRSCTRFRRSTRSATRTSTSSRPTTSTTSATATAGSWTPTRIANNVPVAPDNVGPKTMPNYAALSERRDPQPPRRRQDVRRPGRRPVLRRPRRGLRRHQHRQARPPGDRARQPGRRQGRRLGLQHARVRAAGADVRGHPRRHSVTSAKAPNAVVGVWSTTERRRSRSTRRQRQGRSGCRSAASATR